MITLGFLVCFWSPTQVLRKARQAPRKARQTRAPAATPAVLKDSDSDKNGADREQLQKGLEEAGPRSSRTIVDMAKVTSTTAYTVAIAGAIMANPSTDDFKQQAGSRGGYESELATEIKEWLAGLTRKQEHTKWADNVEAGEEYDPKQMLVDREREVMLREELETMLSSSHHSIDEDSAGP